MRILINMVYALFILVLFNQVVYSQSVLIDPGHGGGTSTSVDGVYEEDIVLPVGLKLYDAVDNSGVYTFHVFITRRTDIFFSPEFRWKMANREGTMPDGAPWEDAYGNKIPEDGVDAFISIHTNTVNNTSSYGTELYVGTNDTPLGRKKKSINFATVALQTFLHSLRDFFDYNDYTDPQIKSRWVRTHTVDVLQYTKMPAILIELDYLTNEIARDYLQHEGYQHAAADGLWRALEWTHPNFINFVEEVVESNLDPTPPTWTGKHVLIRNTTPIGTRGDPIWPTVKSISVLNGTLSINWGDDIIVDDMVSLVAGAGGAINVDESCTTDHIILGKDASIAGFDPDDEVVQPGGTYPIAIVADDECEVHVWPKVLEYAGVPFNTTITTSFYEHETGINHYNFIYEQENDVFVKYDWKKGSPLTTYGDSRIFALNNKYYKYLRFYVSANPASEESKGITNKAYNDIIGNGNKTYFMDHTYARIGKTTFKTYLNTIDEFYDRDVVEFKDPWYISLVDPQYTDGNLPRKNLGRDAEFRRMDGVTINGGNKGVFLNITKDKVYYDTENLYKVQRDPLNNSFDKEGQTWIFDRWSGVNVDIDDPISKTSSVVFTDENSEVWAHYKGHFISNSDQLFGESNGRQLVSNRNFGDDLEHYMVYQDNGEIYFTKYYFYDTVNPEEPDYFKWTLEERISDGSGLNKNPSIAFMSEDKYIVVWQKENEIVSLEYDFYWQDITSIEDAINHPNPQPAVGVYYISGMGSGYTKQIIWIDNEGLILYENQQEILIPGTNSSCKNPSITNIYASPSSGFGSDNIIVWENSVDGDIYYHKLDESTTYNLTSGFTEISNNKSPSIAAGMIQPMITWQATKNGKEMICAIRMDDYGLGDLTEIEYTGFESIKPVVGTYGYGDYKLLWKLKDTDLLASLKYVSGNWQSLNQIKTYYDDALSLPVMSEYSEPENVVAASRYSSIPFNLVVDPVPATILVSNINTPTTLVAGTIYHVKETLTVTNGAVLTIEAGVQIRLDPYTKIIVENGSSIEANGTEIDPISFSKSGASAWDRIELFGGNNEFEWCVFDGGTYNVDIRSCYNTFSNCTFKNATRGISTYKNGGIWADFDLNECMIENNLQGIVVSYAYAGINNCTIRNNTCDGLYLWSARIGNNTSYGSKCGLFTNNYVHNNGTYGIRISSDAKLWLSYNSTPGHNKIEDNGSHEIYIASSTSARLYESNIGGYGAIFDNSGYYIYNLGKTYDGEQYILVEVSAEENYWGPSGPSPANFYGPVDYLPRLTSDPTGGAGAENYPASIIPDAIQITQDVLPGEIGSLSTQQMIASKLESADLLPLNISDPGKEISKLNEKLLVLINTIKSNPSDPGNAARLNELYNITIDKDPEDELMKKDDIVDIIAGYRESLMTMDRKIDFENQDSIYSIQLIGEIAALLEIYDSIINQEYEDAINLAKKYDEYIHNSDNRRELLQFKLIANEILGKYQEALTVIDDLEIEVEFEYELYTAPTYELIKQNLLEQLGQASLNKPHFLKDSNPLLTELNSIPTDFSLGNIYPNPFNPVTQLPLGLPEDSQVKIDVYNMLGQKVAQLANGQYSPGNHIVQFDGSNLSSGVYIIYVQIMSFKTSKNHIFTTKAILMK